MSAQAIYQIFHDVTVEKLLKSDKVITLKSTDSVEKAVKTFSDNKILSCPVVDEAGALFGLVDVLDVLKFITSAAPNDAALSADELKSLEISGRAIALMPIKSVINDSGRDALITVFSTDPASEALKHMSAGAHRVVVTSKDKEIFGVLSQSDLNRYLVEELPKGDSKHIAAKKLSELGYASGKLETVSKDAQVLKALQLLDSRQVSQLAVVDEAGKIIGNFSASNLRGLYREKYPHFLHTIEDFLKEYSPKSLSVVSANPDTSLLEIVQQLAETGLHHLWVVVDEKPTGIISLTDIMNISINN